MAATIGVPLYACGGGTIPLLQAWLMDGMSAGSAAGKLSADSTTIYEGGNHEILETNFSCGTVRHSAVRCVLCSLRYLSAESKGGEGVLEDIRRNARLFSEDAEKAAQRLMELKCADQQKQTATMKRDLASAKKRLADLDVKLKRTYEDNMSGKLPDHIFTMFIADYDTERATLKANIAEMEKALEKVRDTKADI